MSATSLLEQKQRHCKLLHFPGAQALSELPLLSLSASAIDDSIPSATYTPVRSMYLPVISITLVYHGVGAFGTLVIQCSE